LVMKKIIRGPVNKMILVLKNSKQASK